MTLADLKPKFSCHGDTHCNSSTGICSAQGTGMDWGQEADRLLWFTVGDQKHID